MFAASCRELQAASLCPPASRGVVVFRLEDWRVCRAWGLGFGALVFASMAQVTIDTIKNGPYIVTGEVELIDADGNKYPVEKRMALCRCGASTEKPFCDGTHSKVGFQAAEKAVPESKE